MKTGQLVEYPVAEIDQLRPGQFVFAVDATVDELPIGFIREVDAERATVLICYLQPVEVEDENAKVLLGTVADEVISLLLTNSLNQSPELWPEWVDLLQALGYKLSVAFSK